MSPDLSEIKRARLRAGLTQTQAAEVIYSTKRTWQDWEGGLHQMHPALWELFKLKVGSDPRVKLVKRG